MDLELRAAAAVAATALTLAVFVPYARAILRGLVRPHICSWVAWGVGTVVVSLAQLADGAGLGAWPMTASGAISCGIAVLAWRQGGTRDLRRVDLGFLLAALSALPLWWIARDPLAAVVLLTASDLLGFGPTLRRAWHAPHQEAAGFFALGALRNALLIAALGHHSATTVLFPAVVGGACLVVAGIVTVRRRRLARSVPAEVIGGPVAARPPPS